MQRHEIQLRLGPSDTCQLAPLDLGSTVLRLDLINRSGIPDFGLRQIADELGERGLAPSPTAMELLALAIGVQVADTRISREKHAQDSWTREIDLNVPVSNPTLWDGTKRLIERTLRFLSGDRWSLLFRQAPTIPLPHQEEPKWPNCTFDCVSLFSGGMDSYLGAIELLAAGKHPLLVSHYWDQGTSSQAKCALHLSEKFGDIAPRHLRAYIGADKNNFPLPPGERPENTQRARSFIFFALAVAAASSLGHQTTIHVPENGLVSLNVPLDPHRLGAWTTRTTHPFYMARWNELLKALGIAATLVNPYQIKTKGEMLLASPEPSLVSATVVDTLSCSSVTKARWSGLPTGHCGHCFPCIVRRAAEIKGLGGEVTTYQALPHLNHTVDKQKAVGADLWSFKVMVDRLSVRPDDAKALVHKTGPLGDHDLTARLAFANTFLRGITEVGQAISGTTFK
jgi:7-cyano-7-deazaguanine synthase in queuosine biosynthesis